LGSDRATIVSYQIGAVGFWCVVWPVATNEIIVVFCCVSGSACVWFWVFDLPKFWLMSGTSSLPPYSGGWYEFSIKVRELEKFSRPPYSGEVDRVLNKGSRT